MIGYFSATGNSRWVAQQLAALTGDVLCNITDSLKEGCLPALPDDTERVGIVFPIQLPCSFVCPCFSLPLCRVHVWR